MTAQQIADANLATAMRAQGLVNEGGVWFTPAQLLNRRASGSVTPGTITNPANEPPPLVSGPDIGPLISGFSDVAPPTPAPTPAVFLSPPLALTNYEDDSSSEGRLAREDGRGDGGKKEVASNWRGWDDPAPKERKRRKKAKRKVKAKGKR